jgi:maltoporin
MKIAKKHLKVLPLALSLAFAFGAARADAGHDTDGFHGYFRDGAGSSSANGPQSCFGLGGNTNKYRLGNECDAYFEGGYTWTIAKADDGVSFAGTIWAKDYSPSSDFGSAPLQVAKAYVEAKGLDFMNGGVAWVGKRYYYRPDIHMLDFQYINLNGTGAGLDGIKLGAGKFSYGVFKDNDLNVTNSAGAVTSSTAALRQNFLYEGLPTNQGGTIDMALTLVKGTASISPTVADGHNGWNVNAFHHQDFMGGGNTLGLQYGVGAASGVGSHMGNSSSTTFGNDVKQVRVFDDLVIQPTKQFSMEFAAVSQKVTSNASGGSSTWTSLGVRPVYAIAPHIKLQMELGTDSVTSPTGGPTERLTKITFAPTIAMGESYWSRPELRLFVTHGMWNSAASNDVNSSNNSGPVYGTATGGTSVGVQLEAWW